MKKIMTLLAGALTLAGCAENYQEYFDSVVKELSDPSYCGRSDYNDGDVKAATYIIAQLKDMGIKPCPAPEVEPSPVYPPFKSPLMPCDARRWSGAPEEDLAYLQHFCYPLNVMRGAMELKVDGVEMKPNVDFIAKEFSPSCCGEFPLATLGIEYYTPELFSRTLNSGEFAGKFVIIDWDLYHERLKPNPFEKYLPYMGSLDNIGGLILRQDEQFPYFKARTYYTTPRPVLMVNKSFPVDAKSIYLNIESDMIPSHDAHNIIAYIPGKSDSKEYIAFNAHYDHLEMMGKDNFFPGANDNASGVAMLLSLARYYSKHQPEYSMQFIFTDGEEENLLGAFYYTNNPSLPLEDIKYLVELDMVGDNGDTFTYEVSDEGREGFAIFEKINAGSKNPVTFNFHELNDNSDNYAFAIKGVPCVYMTTEGDMNKYYHTPLDTYEHFSDANFGRLFNMITKFVDKI